MTDRADTLIVGGRDVEAPSLHVRNFRDPEVVRFKGQSRVGRVVDEIILHETVTRSTAATVSVLVKRKLGVQLIVGPTGRSSSTAISRTTGSPTPVGTTDRRWASRS